MNHAEKLARLKALSLELAAFATKAKSDAWTAEDQAAATTAQNEYNAIGQELTDIANLAKAGTADDKYAHLFGSAGTKAAGRDNGDGGDGRKTRGDVILELTEGLGDKFYNSPEFQAWKKNGGSGNSEKFKAGRILPTALSDKKSYREEFALISTADLPTYAVPPTVLPGIQRPGDYRLTARDVLASGRTESNAIIFLQENVFTNAAAAVAEAQADNTPDGTKPESNITFTQVTAPVVTIAHWIPITRQTWQDAPAIVSLIENRLMIGLDREVNEELWVGDGTNGQLTGLFETGGVQIADDTYFGSNATQNAGSDLEDFERILRAVTNVDLLGDAVPTFVGMNPRDNERLRTIADAEDRYLGGSPFNGTAVPTIWGLPVSLDRSIPVGEFMVGDGNAAMVWDRMDAEISMDTVGNQFIQNKLTLLAETRVALTVFRPKAFVHGTFTS